MRRLTDSLLLTVAATIALTAVATTAAQGATPIDPALRFRTRPTEHFIVYYHQGEEQLATRLATIAEDAWTILQREMRVTPPGRTHVILTDQTEVSNGFATPLPYNVILVTAVWPAGSQFIGNTDDWLRLVFTHEFTHIVHLDQSEGWAKAVRAVFGRTPFAFPNLFLPVWQIEGLATYEESIITGTGRLHAGDFAAVTREAARAGRAEPLDRVNGGLIDWPDGFAAYAYGVGFHAYLAETYGADTIARLASATSGRVPYTASRAFQRVYGKPLGALWRDYQVSLVESARANATAPPSAAPATRLTHHGFSVSGPRFTSAREIVYAVRTPHRFPALSLVTLDGSAPRQLTTRYLGSTAGVTPDTIYFDQQELRRNVGQYSDLYAFDRRSGRVRQLTFEQRLLDPDISPDGLTIACVQDAPGRRDLVLLSTADLQVRTTSGTTADPSVRATTVSGVAQVFRPAVTAASRPAVLISEPDTQFNAPRWSPDGRLIAVERHRRGALSEIVVVDPSSSVVRVVASRRGARIVTPAWRGDGRAIVAAVSRDDDPFNLFEFPLDGAGERRLTDLTGGAIWPDVSPDGRTLVFVGYTTDGQDLFTIPYPPQTGIPPATAESKVNAADTMADLKVRTIPAGGSPDLPYRPLSTLKPTSWSPVIESDPDQIRVGGAIAGSDVLGYHAYAAMATWLASGPSDTIRPSASRPDWQLYYVYGRWRPVFWVSASDQTSFFAGPASESGTPGRATDHERQIEAGVIFPVTHARRSQAATGSLVRSVQSLELSQGSFTRNRTAIRAAWSATTAHTFGYSISPERGLAAGVTAELVRHALGAFGDATTMTGDLRAYLPGAAPHHVAAIRLAGGFSTGDNEMQRTFLLGGAGPNVAVQDFGRDALSLLRGFGANRFGGSHVALVNADYRVPLARPQRGVGTWPLFLQTIHASLFADVGHAWTRLYRTRDLKADAGAELSANVVAGYFLPLTVTVGAAWGRDGSGSAAGGATAYVRIGRAF